MLPEKTTIVTLHFFLKKSKHWYSFLFWACPLKRAQLHQNRLYCWEGNVLNEERKLKPWRARREQKQQWKGESDTRMAAVIQGHQRTQTFNRSSVTGSAPENSSQCRHWRATQRLAASRMYLRVQLQAQSSYKQQKKVYGEKKTNPIWPQDLVLDSSFYLIHTMWPWSRFSLWKIYTISIAQKA